MASSLCSIKPYHIGLIRFFRHPYFLACTRPLFVERSFGRVGRERAVPGRMLGWGFRYGRSLFSCPSVWLGLILVYELTWT
jgi:hypothetical protein